MFPMLLYNNPLVIGGNNEVIMTACTKALFTCSVTNDLTCREQRTTIIGLSNQRCYYSSDCTGVYFE